MVDSRPEISCNEDCEAATLAAAEEEAAIAYASEIMSEYEQQEEQEELDTNSTLGLDTSAPTSGEDDE